MISAMVLCAGLGTRLRPLSDIRAKPLVPVGDRPALAHVLDRLRAAGVARVVVNAHHRADEVVRYAVENGLLASDERDRLLGTAGGVARARTMLGEADVLVWNGDILAAIDVAALLDAHASDATLVVRPRAAGEGNVGLDRDGDIVRLRKETTRAGECAGGDFLGVHVIGRALVASLPEVGCLVGDVYLPALRKEARLRAFPYDGAWWDIGTIASYLDANAAWLGARDAWIGEGARVSPSARASRSVIGAGAVVDGAGSLERCVVWPGARAVAPLADAVVASDQVVVTRGA